MAQINKAKVPEHGTDALKSFWVKEIGEVEIHLELVGNW